MQRWIRVLLSPTSSPVFVVICFLDVRTYVEIYEHRAIGSLSHVGPRIEIHVVRLYPVGHFNILHSIFRRMRKVLKIKTATYFYKPASS